MGNVLVYFPTFVYIIYKQLKNIMFGKKVLKRISLVAVVIWAMYCVQLLILGHYSELSGFFSGIVCGLTISDLVNKRYDKE